MMAVNGWALRDLYRTLETLGANRLRDSHFTPWPEADGIIGNPQYLGSHSLAKERGYVYAWKVDAKFLGVPQMADFCVH